MLWIVLISFFQAFRLRKKGIYNNISSTPLQVYINVKETKDLSWLIKGNREVLKVPFTLVPELQRAWERIEDQVIDYYGISRDFQEYVKLKAEIEIMKIMFLLHKKDVWKHRISGLEVQISLLNMGGAETDYYELVASLDHNINGWKMTVKMFFASLKKRVKEQEAINKKAKNNGNVKH